ncbi:MAG: SDR family oxidoreductase, partial [Proteobacteria bacterium]|nr:SDR family oxidoreductase [Burkholderiales bacterium]
GAPSGALGAEFPGLIVPFVVDVRDATAMRAAAGEFLAAHGTPDIVYANAGISTGTLTEHAADAEVFREVIETNLLGILHTLAPFVVPMRAARRGTLAGIASVAGLRGLPGAGAYSASKAAAIAYLESLRIEERVHGIRVVTVCPGYVATALTAGNPYRMPFLLDADDAARRIARVTEQGRARVIVPWQMALVGAAMKVMPDALWDRLLSGAKRKPRRLA